VLFQVTAEMPIGSMVDFTISLPAEVVDRSDVQARLPWARGAPILKKVGRRGVAWSLTNIV